MNCKECIFFIFLFQAIGCYDINNADRPKGEIQQQIKADSSNKNNETEVLAEPPKNEDTIIFKLNSTFRIISAEKQFDTTSSEFRDHLKACNKWKLSEKEILDIFKSSEQISGTEWDLSYAVLPCFYKGQFSMDGKKGDYKVNAGSFIILDYQNNTIFLGCPSKSMYKYFLEHREY